MIARLDMSYHWITTFVIALAIGCSNAPNPAAADAGDNAPEDVAPSDATGDTSRDGADLPDAGATCRTLYGSPVEQTGLTDEQCRPDCAECGAGASASTFDADDLAFLRDAELLDPPAELTDDPYDADPPPTAQPDAVCAVEFDGPATYRLQTYESAIQAEMAGATVTHHGACGLCSTLEDLAAYVDNPDLTAPVRECGLVGIREGEEASIACLTELGFTLPCAQIWYYNTVNTRNECIELCLPALDAPYHDEDGNLNDCLQCDEDESGPIFKAVAGRTRRNSGLASAICRPCESVRPVAHDY
jgi:hypothetical protein